MKVLLNKNYTKIKFMLLLCTIALVLFIHLVYASVPIYENNGFPPFSAIKGTHDDLMKSGTKLEQIIGKVSSGQDRWTLYTITKSKDGEKSLSDSMQLVKLDTNIWIMHLNLFASSTWGIVCAFEKEIN